MAYISVTPNQCDLGLYEQKYSFRSRVLILLTTSASCVQFWGAYFKDTDRWENNGIRSSKRDPETKKNKNKKTTKIASDSLGEVKT